MIFLYKSLDRPFSFTWLISLQFIGNFQEKSGVKTGWGAGEFICITLYLLSYLARLYCESTRRTENIHIAYTMCFFV